MKFWSLKKYKAIVTTLLFMPLLASCEKEIDIDYHEAEKRYVVEASVSNTETSVRISKTNAMDDNSVVSDVSGASVLLTADDGTSEILSYTRNGIYKSSLRGLPGTTYQVDITLDGEHFTSSSTMQRMPVVNEFHIVRKNMFSQNYILADIRLQDIPNENNWYFIHLYRNELGYRWAVMKDDTNPNKELQQLLAFFREGDNSSDVLQEGETLKLVVRAIDQRAYDYLYSMQHMDNTGTNPIDNFTGGCLGYFSAHSEVVEEITYRKSIIEDEE